MPGPYRARVTAPGRLESVRPLACFVVETARSLGLPVVENPLFEVAVVEALTNALEHNRRDNHESLHCDFELAGRTLTIRIIDEAAVAPLRITVPVGPTPWPEPTLDSWESIPESGYGLYLMRAVFPEIRPCERDGFHGVEMAVTF